MNSEEYTKLDQLDRRHWFYQGKRAIVRHWVERQLSLTAEDLWVDAGCGTGTLLVEMSDHLVENCSVRRSSVVAPHRHANSLAEPYNGTTKWTRRFKP